jgi:tRNA(Ile)-lysidine synthase
MLLSIVERALRGPCDVPSGSRVIVAVSGGPDSIALLHLLRDLAPSHPLDLHAAHFNHRIRGAEAEEDARFVADLCGSLGLPLRIGAAEAAPGGRRSEEAAREARYAFLERAAAEVGARSIALGHTRDDQAETVLMRLLAGAGPAGLAGMAPRGPGMRVRPLLAASRGDVLSYLEEKGAAYRTDSSNADPSFLRNRIRAAVMPVILKEVDASSARTLARSAELFREIEEHLTAAATEVLDDVSRREEGKIILAAPRLLTYDRALRRSILRVAAREVLKGTASVGFAHIEALLSLLEEGRSGASAALPGGVVAVLERGRLVIGRGGGGGSVPWGPVPLAIPGVTHLEAAGAILEISAGGGEGAVAPEDPAAAVFDGEEIRPPVVARSRRPGDRIVPFGAAGSRKIQDVLVDAGVPRSERDRVVVVADAAGVLWIAGVRRSDRAPLTARSRRVLTMRIERGGG